MLKSSVSTQRPKILVISSQVVVGRVGLSVIAPAYRSLGIEGFFIPTVLLSSRPGLGTLVKHGTPPSVLAAMLEALAHDGRFDMFDGILTGYFANSEQVAVVAQILSTLRKKRPELTIAVDPVIGDDSTGLYVSESVAEAIRDQLIPIASVITPNRFEFEWLTHTSVATDANVNSKDAIDAIARAMGPDTVFVTSAGETATHLETKCITKTEVFSHLGEKHDAIPNGTGDLFAGLAVAALCNGLSAEQALAFAASAVEGVAKASCNREWLNIEVLESPKDIDTGGAQWVAGVDGCRTGWAVVLWDRTGQSPPRVRMAPTIEDVLNAPEAPSVVAIDIPIGLPAHVGAGGRGPEAAVRKHLGKRKSSVFSIPSRRAVYAPNYRSSCDIALSTSTPPRKVSKQGYMLFKKIRQVDALMTPGLCNRVFEVHPELAFWRLNDSVAMQTPKKIKGRVHTDGMAERRELLVKQGFAPEFFDQVLPKGVAEDDFLDACACAMIAVRLNEGTATPFPEIPQTDENGLTIAIWA